MVEEETIRCATRPISKLLTVAGVWHTYWIYLAGS